MEFTKLKIIPTISTSCCFVATIGGGYVLVKKTQKNQDNFVKHVSAQNDIDFTSYQINDWQLDKKIQTFFSSIEKIIKISEKNIKIPSGVGFSQIGAISNRTLENFNTNDHEEMTLENIIEQDNRVDESVLDEDNSEIVEEVVDSESDTAGEKTIDKKQEDNKDNSQKEDQKEVKATTEDKNEDETSTESQDKNDSESSIANLNDSENVISGSDNQNNPGEAKTNPYDQIKTLLEQKFANTSDEDTKNALSVIQDPEKMALIKKLLGDLFSNIDK